MLGFVTSPQPTDYLGDDITFSSLGITVSVAAIYDQVDNEDVLAFLTAVQA